MTELSQSKPAAGCNHFVRSTLPTLPPPPPPLVSDAHNLLAMSAPPSSNLRDASMRRGQIPLGRMGGARSNNNSVNHTRYNSDPSAIAHPSAETAVGAANCLASSFGSTCTDVDPSCGPLLRRVDDAPPPPSPPNSCGTAAPDQRQQHTFLSSLVPSADTQPGTPFGPTTSSLPQNGFDGEDGQEVSFAVQDSTAPSDVGVSSPSRITSTPPPPEGGTSASTSRSALPAVERARRSGEPRSRGRTASIVSEDGGAAVPVRQFVRRTIVSPSLRSSASANRSPRRATGNDSLNSGVPALSARTDSSSFSHEASASAVAPVRSPTDAPRPTEVRDRPSVDNVAAAPVTPVDDAAFSVRETFPIPRYCPDDLLRGEDKIWSPGKPLRIAYITWNMASKEPRTSEVSAYCIHPNAHLVVVGTQENGPYLLSNKLQRRWVKSVSQVCLGEQYELVGSHHMWAVQMLVFARRRDVAMYVSRAHASHVKTGLMNGLGGNKGGVAVGLVLSLTPKDVEASRGATTCRAATTRPPTPPAERAASVPRHGTVGAGVVGFLARGATACDGGRGYPCAADAAVAPLEPPPPPMLSASRMLHDVEDGDDLDGVDARSLPMEGSGNDVHGAAIGDDDDDAVFSPAEVLSRNASFDLSRQRMYTGESRREQLKRSAAKGGSGRRGRVGGSGGEDDVVSDGTPDCNTPNYMTLLFITAHLAAHQGAVTNRNKDYRQIVRGLQLGRRGPHRKFFKLLLRRKQVLGGDEEGEGSEPDVDEDTGEQWEDDSSEEDVMPLSLPRVTAVAHQSKEHRDVTEEFDLTFFGGDLNYRINGTRKAIEYVIEHHRSIRSILINNDQLSLERARGTIFQGFQEGNLLFRPTYKYEVSAGGGVTLDEYNYSHKKNRMPAYCDRILYKKKMSSAARRVVIRLYTDVPNVRSSDHRPVVALFDVGTRAYTG
ncbi:endonuclease/exonuclease/phosphatase [Novymonas esmeraldas]|uniref:Endonuclease/exonuclease/phosphatase n=1 Tax=Novymonas esmeraldas TaxID=1808958 RepID=A0AAW0F9B9_9TRYP